VAALPGQAVAPRDPSAPVATATASAAQIASVLDAQELAAHLDLARARRVPSAPVGMETVSVARTASALAALEVAVARALPALRTPRELAHVGSLVDVDPPALVPTALVQL